MSDPVSPPPTDDDSLRLVEEAMEAAEGLACGWNPTDAEAYKLANLIERLRYELVEAKGAEESMYDRSESWRARATQAEAALAKAVEALKIVGETLSGGEHDDPTGWLARVMKAKRAVVSALSSQKMGEGQ